MKHRGGQQNQRDSPFHQPPICLPYQTHHLDSVPVESDKKSFTYLPVISLYNMRSIWAKFDGLIDDLEERSVSLSVVNEIWLKEDNEEHRKKIEEIYQMKNVSFLNNPRTSKKRG